MLIWIFFVGDLLSIISIIGMHLNIIGGGKFPLICIIYLGLKGLIFIGDFLSKIDLAITVYMILMLAFNVSWMLTYFAVVFLSYKLAMTLLMR